MRVWEYESMGVWEYGSIWGFKLCALRLQPKRLLWNTDNWVVQD